jgi:transcription elongation factor GreB
MNKAFTKEDDYLEDEDFEDEKVVSPTLQGKNYITPAGLENLKSRYKQLKYGERPEVVKTVSWAAENGDRSENADYQYGKRRLRAIDRELGFLGKRIRSAEAIDPAAVSKKDIVSFGATVTICNEDDEQKTYQIVGVDEAEITLGKISWQSPLASALMNAREGDTIQFRSPKGIQEIEIIKIQFK